MTAPGSRARLIAVARGDAEPDLVVAGARVLCAFTREYHHRETFPLDANGQGDAHVTFAFAAHRAVVDVDTELGLRHRRMISGAYHDAMIMGARVPIGMIFVPSAGGISHHPDEYTAPEDLENGARVLAGTLARLAA